jgi:hypothetical protein
MATGITPTYSPISVKMPRNRAFAVGVGTATAMSCTKGVPVDVNSLTAWASPSTHG